MNVNDLSNRRGKPSPLQIYREYSACKFQTVYYDSLKSAGLFTFAVIEVKKITIISKGEFVAPHEYMNFCHK